MSIVVNAISILNQPKEYLSKIDAEAYRHGQELLSGSSIGEHTRHFIEFFQCLLAQARDQQCINYDKRLRNKLIESDPEHALQEIETIQSLLKEWINSGITQRTCKIESSLTISNLSVVSTTIERELLYNIEHTIHHLAIIKIGLKNLPTPIPVSNNFGVANSTIAYRKQISSSLVNK